MEQSVDSAIHKLIQQEKADDAKLKQTLECEAAVSATQRCLREELENIGRLQKKLTLSAQTGADIKVRLEIARTRSQARVQQLDAMHENIKELKSNVDSNMCSVWERRGELCAATCSLSEQCGVPALLMKRASVVLASRSGSQRLTAPNPAATAEATAVRLRAAEERKKRLLAERARLQLEPEQGDQFIRLRNTLNNTAEKDTAILNYSAKEKRISVLSNLQIAPPNFASCKTKLNGLFR